MQFTEEEIKRFIDAWEKDWGERLTEGDARIQLMRLVELYRVLARPLPENKKDESVDAIPH